MAHPEGIEPPLCDCHGEPKYWDKDATRRGGGRWRCAVSCREKARNYRAANLEKARERDRERGPRRIRGYAGGIEWFLGFMPTVESAQALRARIKQEIPK